MTDNDKIKQRSKLKEILVSYKRNQKKIVFANGCFDLLHRGHVQLLKRAKELGEVLIVAINDDESVRKIKGDKRPINTLSDRAEVLAALDSVDFVTWFSESNPADIIKELEPDILVKGGDWEKRKIIGKETVESGGGKVVTIPYLEGYSTNFLIEEICKRFKS